MDRKSEGGQGGSSWLSSVALPESSSLFASAGCFTEPSAGESASILTAGTTHLGEGYMAVGQCTGLVCKSIRASVNPGFPANGPVTYLVANATTLGLQLTGSRTAGDIMVFGSSHMGIYAPSPPGNSAWIVLSAQGSPASPGIVRYGDPSWFPTPITYYRVLKPC